jgi:hypothetical protein
MDDFQQPLRTPEPSQPGGSDGFRKPFLRPHRLGLLEIASSVDPKKSRLGMIRSITWASKYGCLKLITRDVPGELQSLGKLKIES